MLLWLTGAAQAQTYCPPGQAPYFIHGFAFLKDQLGDLMGEPLECEHYDPEGNAFQRTTTGQASYLKQTNTPTFTSGARHWAWTSRGLEQWLDQSGPLTTANPSPSLAPQTIRVMSYNILYGAGATPYWEQRAANQSPFSYPGNRLPDVLEVIRAAEPDIVGIQEAAGWASQTPPIVQQVADSLGMRHYLAETPSGLHLALLTRFELVEAENLSAQIGNIGALRATLALTETGQLLHVFVVHLDPFSAATRSQQINRLIQEMAPYLESPTILMGDTNIACVNQPDQCEEYRLLNQAGWQLVMKEKYVINQIWTSPALAESVEEIAFPGATFEVSDHLPVGAVLKTNPFQ
jgi:endonuclease/exonuclease/phosphatase family metal-dependent hydrolase